VLQYVSAGVDLFDGLYPITLAEAGTALTFEFGAVSAGGSSGGSGSGAGSAEGERTSASERGGGEGGDGGGSGAGSGRRSPVLKANLYSNKWQTDLTPLVEGCPCIACTRYTKAYIYHLLTAHEMLGIVALTHHNICHYNLFFQHIRETIANGTFEAAKAFFLQQYFQPIGEEMAAGE
jgi:queuine/archaeosine tRNA-ribosyltransferase